MNEKILKNINEKGLIEMKNDLITRAEEVLNKAKAEERELTDEEMAELTETRDNTRRIIKMLEEANLKDFFDKADQKSKQEIDPDDKENMKATTPEQEHLKIIFVGKLLMSVLENLKLVKLGHLFQRLSQIGLFHKFLICLQFLKEAQNTMLRAN